MLNDELNKYLSYEYLKCIFKGLEFDISKLSNNIIDNEIIIRDLCGCFTGIYYIISEDISFIPYFQNKNLYLSNLCIRHTSFRLSILNDNNIELNDKLLLISILDLIAVYMYINKETFNNKEYYLDIFIDKINNNLEIYKNYFIENNVFDLESFLGPISSDGFIKEFIIVGNIIHDIYLNNIKIKKYE